MEKLLLLAGPAGTGKTESVKALGHQLGRFVLVFNCDETFDFQVLCERSYIFVQLGLSFFVLIFKNTTPPFSPGHGSYLRGSLPSGRLGLLRRVQPSGGENALCRLSASPVHPSGLEGAQQPQQRQKYVLICRKCPDKQDYRFR